jgi:hypothetical protein
MNLRTIYGDKVADIVLAAPIEGDDIVIGISTFCIIGACNFVSWNLGNRRAKRPESYPLDGVEAADDAQNVLHRTLTDRERSGLSDVMLLWDQRYSMPDTWDSIRAHLLAKNG